MLTLRQKYTKLHVHFKAKSEIHVLTLNIERHNVNTKRNQLESKPTAVVFGETESFFGGGEQSLNEANCPPRAIQPVSAE